jgi:acetoin utilization protein AcuB
MSKVIPTVQKFMTYNPITINASKTVAEAQSVMKEKQIRHLPVVEQDKIVGIISDRDVRLVLSLVQASPQNLKIKDIAHSSVYTVHPETPIDQVADEMAAKHYGCAVVEDNHKLVGIFTTVDALKAISDICHQRYHLSL